MLDQAMDALAEEMLRWGAQWNPVFGTYIGIHDYDHMLPDGSLTALKEEIRILKEYRSRLASLKPQELSPGRRIDRRFLIQAIDINLFDEEVLEQSAKFPQAPGNFGTAIMLLFNREFAPLPDRLQSISARLAASPKHLMDIKERLTKPVKLFAELGIESCSSLPGLLKLVEGVAKSTLTASDFTEMAENSAKAAEALKDHEKWLKEVVLPRSKDEIGIGPRNFDRMLKIRELGYTTDEIRVLGEKSLASAKSTLKDLAAQIKPGASVDEVKDLVQAKHPKDFAEALDMTRSAMKESKEFIRKKDLATFPPSEELVVIETPEYLRHVMPIAAYMPPSYFDQVQQGIYLVTPVQKDSKELTKHSYAKNWLTAVHEGYPGHHLHSSCAASTKSYARAYTSAIETVEGWALYCEEMMPGHGFHPEPEVKFAQTLDLIWRACRVIIDIDLHRRKMTFKQAVDMLMKEAGLEKASATAEVKRYTYTPGYPLSYLLGKHMILDLKAKAKKEMAGRYTEKLFHDTFLYAGLMPMALIREVFEQKFAEMKGA